MPRSVQHHSVACQFPLQRAQQKRSNAWATLQASPWRRAQGHVLSGHAHLSDALHIFFPSLYCRQDTITRFINSLLQGLEISPCDGLTRTASALTLGLCTHQLQEINCNNNATFPSPRYESPLSLPPSPLPTPSPFSCSLKHSTGFSQQ